MIRSTTSELREEIRLLRYKEEEFEVLVQFYYDLETGEEYTTTKTDTVTLFRLYQQYFKKFRTL